MSVVTYQVASPGTSWIEEDRGIMSLVVEKDGVETPYQRDKTLRRRIDVLGATPTIVTRARITYLEHVVIERQGGAERRRPTPLEGKRYILDVTEGALRVTLDDGTPPPRDEEAAVRDEEKRFGRSETLAMVIARLRYRPGEATAVPAATAARLFPDQDVTAMEVTHVGTSGRDAHFTLKLGLTNDRAAVKTRMDAAGVVRLDSATGQLVEMKLLGPVRVSGAMVAEGTGELSITQSPVPV